MINHALRFVALAACLFGLSGCNLVFSEEPWFAAVVAVEAPAMRDGLWRNDDPDCPFDDTRPAERWPDCAQASFVRGGERWTMEWEDTDERGRRRRAFAGWAPASPPSYSLFVTNGDHLIVQVDTLGPALERALPEGDPLLEHPEAESVQQPPSFDDAGGESDEPAERYMYIAFRAVGHDQAGKVTATESWGVQCGPIVRDEPAQTSRRRRRADSEEEGTAESSVTDRPFPGLTVVGSNCVAESVEALRRAAVLSEGLEKKNGSRWVREGWR